jgi:hypothetical protein
LKDLLALSPSSKLGEGIIPYLATLWEIESRAHSHPSRAQYRRDCTLGSPYFLGNFLDAISLYVIKGKHDPFFFRKRVDELF